MSNLFGTDGIRGVANEDLKPSLAHALGRAIATRLAGPGGHILVGQDKIVLMATHDPILALMGDRRVVINNGGMIDVIEPTARERANLDELRALDARLMGLRHRLRMGERLDAIS